MIDQRAARDHQDMYFWIWYTYWYMINKQRIIVKHMFSDVFLSSNTMPHPDSIDILKGLYLFRCLNIVLWGARNNVFNAAQFL